MLLWRLSRVPHARTLDGGYGLLFDGRWNTAGHAVTYCSTSPSLCVLEKLVHIEVSEFAPPLMMVRYEIPDGLAVETVGLSDLPEYWQTQESWTRARGDRWHDSEQAPLLRVPSAIVPLDESPDANLLINHRHPAATLVRIVRVEPFALDARLF